MLGIVIRAEDALPLLQERVPGFVDSPEGQEVDDEDGTYIHVMYAVIYVHRRLHEGDDAPLAALLDPAEQFLGAADRQVRFLGSAGIVEDLTNRNYWADGLAASTLLDYLGPKAKALEDGVILAELAAEGYVK